ncbi:MAG: cobalamin adenosyltransferase [Parcubacteria group bacterium LiPW_15]|nr:MAG: cobalamin adenosyltransferase [Parcubacteria group bacterium LiPW_15]
MGLFYTGKGDKGVSEVWDGKKLDKTSVELVALGDLDELNSLLGLVRSRTPDKNNKKVLLSVQDELFTIQANIYLLAIGRLEKAPELGEEKVRMVERIIDALEEFVGPERGFVISGEDPEEAWLDFARAVARRAERSAIELNKKMALPENVLAYLNRLSSLLFAMGRASAKKRGKKEKGPSYK